jgi:hypothetical protein
MNRLGAINRLAKLGLRGPAEAYREEVRIRHKAAGKSRDEALELAWLAMWEEFRPIVERLEANSDGPPEPPLPGSPADDLTAHLDPSYSETDPGKRLRDGLLWTAEEIRRVVVDDPSNPDSPATSIDLSRATTPPPTAWALFVLESYARKPPSARAELIARVMPLASKTHDPTTPAPGTSGASFLDQLGNG